MVRVFEEFEEDELAMGRLFDIHSHYKTHDGDMWQTSRAVFGWEITRLKEKNFIGVIRAARRLQATDPRDRIYAFLGGPFAKDKTGELVVEADYALSIEELYLQFAYTMLQCSREGPWCLSAIEHGHRSSLFDNVYHSWVPRWHVSLGSPYVASPGHWYRAGGCSGHFSARITGHNTLMLGGALFDKVVWMSASMGATNFSMDSGSWDSEMFNSREPSTDSLWKNVVNEATNLGIGLQKEDYVYTLMTGYPGADTCLLVDSPQHLAVFEAYQRVIRSVYRNPSDTEAMAEKESMYQAFFKDQMRLIDKRRLILTENGRLGLVSSGAIETGDVYYIFFDVTVPFILTPANNGRHKLIAECYVHGVMDGELVERLESGDVGRQQILLD